MKGSLKTIPQDDSSIPKKKVSLAQLKLYLETSWVTGRKSVLQEPAKDSRFLALSTGLELHQCKKAKTAEGGSHTGYLSKNLRRWLAACIASDMSAMKNKMFGDF